MQCKQCSLEAVKEELCRKHYIDSKELIYLDNSDWDNMGIILWLRDFLAEHFRNSFPKEHLEVYQMLLELYDPRYLNKMHRLRELIAFRSFAKSKIIMGFFCYVIAHNGMKMKIKSSDGLVQEVTLKERLMVIFSETGGMAEDFVTNIRTEFSGGTNPMIAYFYKFKIEDAMDNIDKSWTKRIFKINKLFVMGLGEGMQARGRVKGAYRLTFAAYDDIYSENNTKTPESRKAIRDWFNNSAQHTVDDLEGKSFLAGTIITDDSILVDCEGSKSWRTLKFYPMPIVKFRKFIKEHILVDLNKDECKLPFEDIEEEFERIEKQNKYFMEVQDSFDWELTWPDRINLYSLVLKYKEAIEGKNQTSINGFFQEYFHITVPSETKQFRPEYFQNMGEWSISHEFGYNWLRCEKLYADKPQMINIEMGLDTSGGKSTGDNCSWIVGGVTADGRGFVLENKYGKFSMRDNIEEDNPEYFRIDKVIEDRSYVQKTGYIDEGFRLAVIYHPKVIKIGEAGAEAAITTEIQRVFRKNENYTPVMPRPQNREQGKKTQRIRDTMIGRYETRSMFHRDGLDNLEYELEFLDKTKHDDCADSLEVAFFNIQRPQAIDYNFFMPKEIKKQPTLGVPKELIKERYDWRL